MDLEFKTCSTQQLGVRCLELSVKEVDKAIKNLLLKSSIDLSDIPSWKFPHLIAEQLDATSFMASLEDKPITESEQLRELLELLVDRLYFSVIIIFKHLLPDIPHIISGQEDCGPAKGSSQFKINYDLIQCPQAVNLNIGHLLQKVCEHISSQNHREALVLPSKNNRSICTLKSCKIKDLSSNVPQNEPCASCFLAKNILKILADTVNRCLINLGQSSSHILKFRESLQESIWTLSQTDVVVQWCEALELDSQDMITKAETIVEQNESLNVEASQLRLTLKQDIQLLADSQKQLSLQDKELKKEQSNGKKQKAEKKEMLAQFKDAEDKLKGFAELFETSEARIILMESRSKEMEGVVQELEMDKGKLIVELDDVKQQLQEEKNERSAANFRITALESKLCLKEQELFKMKAEVEKVKSFESSQLEIEKAVQTMKTEVKSYHRTIGGLEATNKTLQNEVNSFKGIREKMEGEIELLTLYPDLNGPINPPTKTAGNPVEAMEMQVQSNEIRMKVLSSQTERLSNTLTKLRAVHSEFR